MAGKRDKNGSGRGVVIVKKFEAAAGGGHGGAWKVAYADFVTAMMAFFLLMWLLNATTEDQRKGLADYFSPNSLLSHASSGTGQPFGGHTAFDQGALVSDRGSVEITEGKRPPLNAIENGDPKVFTRAAGPTVNDPDDVVADKPDPDADTAGHAPKAAQSAAARTQDGDRPPTEADIEAEKARREKAAFEKAADEIREAVRGDPGLADLAKQLAIDMTPEGLRIQIMDELNQPMFATGLAVPNDRARALLLKVAPVLQKLPEAISIAGYTDAAPYAGVGKTNWELSSERANATRRLLTDSGLAETRVRTVTGHADRDPLLPGDPLAAANRRIAIVVLRDTTPTRTADRAAQSPAQASPTADRAAQGAASAAQSGDPSRPPSAAVPRPADRAALPAVSTH